MNRNRAVIHEKCLLLLGAALSTFCPAAAQSIPARVAPIQARPEPAVTSFRTSTRDSLRSVALSDPLPQTRLARFSQLASKSYPTLGRLLPSLSNETFFASQWRLPVVGLWGGHLQVGIFDTTLHMDNIMFGPAPRGSLRDFGPPRLGLPRGPRAADLYGVSLAFRFDRDGRTGRLLQPSRLMRLLGSD